jgi:hypothetical protein
LLFLGNLLLVFLCNYMYNIIHIIYIFFIGITETFILPKSLNLETPFFYSSNKIFANIQDMETKIWENC